MTKVASGSVIPSTAVAKIPLVPAPAPVELISIISVVGRPISPTPLPLVIASIVWVWISITSIIGVAVIPSRCTTTVVKAV